VKHLFGKPTLNVRKTRWIEFLSEYDLEIKHIKGEENQFAGALGKRAHEVHISAINMDMKNLKDEILKLENSYRHYLPVRENLYQSNLE
jgi:hypothetical protein